MRRPKFRTEKIEAADDGLTADKLNFEILELGRPIDNSVPSTDSTGKGSDLSSLPKPFSSEDIEILPPDSEEESNDEIDLEYVSGASSADILPDDQETIFAPSTNDEDPLNSPSLQLDAATSGGKATSNSNRDVIPYDPLQTYLRDIRRHKPLSREEEQRVALRYFHNRDKKAAYKLVVANLWLVVKIARDYETAARNLLDLIQEGNIGLLEAVKNFDPYRQVRFPSYAAWWIKAYIIRYLIANWRLVKIGTTQAQRKLFFNLRKERERLEREGIYPGPKLIAQNLNVKESEVIEMEQRLGAPDLSVDAPINDTDTDSSLHGVLPSSDASAEDLVSQQQRQMLIAENIEAFQETLNDKQRVVFQRRLLAEDEDKATLQDVSEIIHVSRERVRQIENQVKDKLKEFLVKRLGASIEDIIA